MDNRPQMTSAPIKPLLITNSHQPGALGDALASIPALSAYLPWALKANQIDSLIWQCPHIKTLFPDLPVPQYTAQEVEDLGLDLRHVARLDTQEVVRKAPQPDTSLVQKYGKALGVDLPSDVEWPPIEGLESQWLLAKTGGHPYTLLAPFSHSDGGTLTKVWPMWKWHKIAGMLKERGSLPVILGLKTEPSESFKEAGFVVLESRPLVEVAWAMKNAQATITVDNGLGWLAQASKANHILILSSNMPQPFSWNPRPNARNLSNCATISTEKVWAAWRDLVGLG